MGRLPRHGYALRLVQPLGSLQRSHSLCKVPGYIGSIMRAPSYASDHHRKELSPEPILHRAPKRICLQMQDACGCDDESATCLLVLACPCLRGAKPQCHFNMRPRGS